MRNRGGIFRYLTVCLICCSVIGYSIYSYFSRDNSAVEAGGFLYNDYDGFAFAEEPADVFEEIPSEATTGTASATENPPAESAAPAAAPSVAKGRIISRYISPYTAPASYNGVYLKNSTELSVDIEAMLKEKLGFSINKSKEPEVLIMHTHTTESYMIEDTDYYTAEYTSRSREKDKNMVRIGDIVSEKLNAAGIKTIHDTTEHDYPKYSGSYGRAAETITGYLKKYPTIKIVLDLHRDAVASGDSDKVKFVTEINGKKAAQVMIVMGSQSGGVKNFPDWKENFKLALRLQQTIEVKYPTLARPLSLMSKNYNESLTKGSLLIEFGTDANTVKEAEYSAELVGDAVASLLNTLK